MSPYPPGTIYSGNIVRNVAIAFTVLETIFVVLRYWAQYLARKRFGVDDGLIFLAFLLCIAGSVVSLIGITSGGIGYHEIDVAEHDPEALIVWAKILVIGAITYCAACALPKIVVLTLYLRIFYQGQKGYCIVCWILIFVVSSLAIADIVSAATMCVPIQSLWDKSIKGKCIDIAAFYRWGSLPNILSDLAVLVLPMPVVWSLQVEKKVKVGLTITFLTGSIGMVTSIVRCVEFFSHDPLVDGTWVGVKFLYWSIIEPGVYLIAACLPCYRPLAKLFSNKVGGSSVGTRGKLSTTGVSGLSRSFGGKKDQGYDGYQLEIMRRPSQEDEENLVRGSNFIIKN